MDSFIDCSYCKVKLYEVTCSLRARNGKIDHQKRIDSYNEDLIKHPKLSLKNDSNLKEKCRKIIRMFHSTENEWTSSKELFLARFSSASFDKLSTNEKMRHSITNCTGCAFGKDYRLHYSFPAMQASKPLLKVFQESMNITSIPRQTTGHKLAAASRIYECANLACTTATGSSLTELLPSIEGANLERKKTKSERQKERDGIARSIKKEMEGVYHEADIELPYKNRESVSRYGKRTRSEMTHQDPKPKKRHTSVLIDYDIDGLIRELNTFPDSSIVNFADLGNFFLCYRGYVFVYLWLLHV